MKNTCFMAVLGGSLLLLVVGCQSGQPVAGQSSTPAVAATTPAATPAAAPANPPPAALKVVRIKAGASAPVTDTAGNVWLADQGFDGGDVIERPGTEIANTKEPAIYQSEHYAMEGFSWPLPDGKYQVRLHFCETYDGVTGPGERVFTYVVQGREFKDFDVWKAAGGPQKAFVQPVDVDVTGGKLVIKFISNVENPQINGIEILPAN